MSGLTYLLQQNLRNALAWRHRDETSRNYAKLLIQQLRYRKTQE